MNSPDRKRILLVDDDRHLLVTLSDYLIFEGFDVTQARTGEESLRKLGKVNPDLIILDIAMPGMGGTGFLKRMPLAEGGRRYPVLVLTARSAMESFFDEIEVEGFLAKPCSEADLLKRINAILSRNDPALRKTERKRMRILLGENERKLAEPIKRVLEAAGYRVDVVRTGPAMLERATVVRPHLVLMKELLPKIKGSAVAPLLEAMPSLHKTPVLIYDETREVGEDRNQRYRVPSGAAKVLASDLPDVLLKAVDDTLQG